MNDVVCSSSKFNFILYADDTTLGAPLLSTTDTENALSTDINTELNRIFDWLCVNKLSINVKKTKFIIHHHTQRHRNTLPKLNLNIDNIPIEQVQTFNFLGVIIEEHLNWNEHIKRISLKISRTTGVLKRLHNILPIDTLLIMYNALVVPHLQYGILAWGFKTSRLLKLQKKAIRIVCKEKYNAHTEQLFKRLNCLRIDDIFIHNTMKFYYRYIKNELPSYFKDFFTERFPTHQYATRQQNIPLPNTPSRASSQNSIRYYIPKVLDTMPNIIKDKLHTHSFQGFSRYLKMYLVNNYEIDCHLPNCYVCGR